MIQTSVRSTYESPTGSAERTTTMLQAILLTITTWLSGPVADVDVPCGSEPAWLELDGQWVQANTCDSTYHCTRCNDNKTICDGCSAGEGPGDVFTCVGCYSGDSHCAIGSSGSNSCCD